jgi:hypothetical protein
MSSKKHEQKRDARWLMKSLCGYPPQHQVRQKAGLRTHWVNIQYVDGTANDGERSAEIGLEK